MRNEADLITEFWECLQSGDAVDDELFEECDDYSIQQVLNSQRGGKLPTEYLCESNIENALNNLSWITEKGGQVTDDCYRSVLRNGQNYDLLKPLVSSGHFPLSLGTTFTLDWIVSSVLGEDEDPLDNQDLQMTLVEIFETSKAESEARNENHQSLVAGKAFESGAAFESFVKLGANRNCLKLPETQWYTYFGLSFDKEAESKDERVDTEDVVSQPVEEPVVTSISPRLQQTPAPKAQHTLFTPKPCHASSFITPAASSSKGGSAPTPSTSARLFEPNSQKRSFITPTPKRPTNNDQNVAKRFKAIH